MSVVRPEFGPTLPQLLGPRVRALPRVAQAALALLAVLVVAVVAWRVLAGEQPENAIVVRSEPAFNFIYRAPLQPETPREGELARVAADRASFVVRPLKLPAYRGDAAGTLPVFAAQEELRLGRELPGFLWRSDGRANINKIQGYQVVYQYRRDGRLTYGLRIYLLPTTTVRDGVELVLEAPQSEAVPNAASLGRNGALKTSLRSFRFGTERP